MAEQIHRDGHDSLSVQGHAWLFGVDQTWLQPGDTMTVGLTGPFWNQLLLVTRRLVGFLPQAAHKAELNTAKQRSPPSTSADTHKNYI